MVARAASETKRTLTVEECCALVGCGRQLGYKLANRGDWPAIRAGRLIKIPTARFYREVLGEEPPNFDRGE